MLPTEVKPVLCLQKGILSPSCLPAFGKVNFRSLCRLISHCERDFSFASERDSHFFDKMILPHFSPHVNHVKLFHLVMLDLRSVRDPGRLPCPDALLRVGVMRGDNGLVGALTDWLGRCGMCLCAVFYNMQVILLRNLHNGSHVTRLTVQMHWHNSFRLFRNFFFNLCRIDIKGTNIRLYKNRSCSGTTMSSDEFKMGKKIALATFHAPS